MFLSYTFETFYKYKKHAILSGVLKMDVHDKKRLLYTLAAALFVVALVTSATGLATGTNDGQSDSSQYDNYGITGSLNVSGTASISVEPDQGIIILGVHTEALTASETTLTNAEIMNRIKEALENLGIPENEIQTVTYRLSPRYVNQYDVHGNYTGQRFVGYTLDHKFQVTVDNLNNISEAIDTAVNAGANRVDSVEFTVKGAEEIRLRAIREATLSAKAKAETIAGTLGVNILGVSSVSECNAWVVPNTVRLEYDAISNSSPPTPIQPCLAQISASVSVTFAIG